MKLDAIMKKEKTCSSLMLCFIVTIYLMAIGCGSGDESSSKKKLSSEKEITAFYIQQNLTEIWYEGTIDQTAKTITFNLPKTTSSDGKDLGNLWIVWQYKINTTGICYMGQNSYEGDPEFNQLACCGTYSLGSIMSQADEPSPHIFDVYARAEDGSMQRYIVSMYIGDNSGSGTSGNAGTDPGGTGDISMTLTWSWSNSSSSEGPDIDMWVTDPNEHRLTTSRDDYSLGPCPCGGQIDFDDLGGWGPGDGGGPERAFWPTGSAPSGTYTYGVKYYQGDGTANYTLKVYKGTTLYATKTGILSAPGNYITLGTVTKGTSTTDSSSITAYDLQGTWVATSDNNNEIKLTATSSNTFTGVYTNISDTSTFQGTINGTTLIVEQLHGTILYGTYTFNNISNTMLSGTMVDSSRTYNVVWQKK